MAWNVHLSPYWAKMQLLGLFFSLLLFSLSHALPVQGDFEHQLQPRDLSWLQMVQKGEAWEHAMKLPAAQAKPYMKKGVPVTSPFTEYSSLARWGWTVHKEPGSNRILDQVFKTLEISQSNNQLIRLVQSESVKNDQGQEVDASDGEYLTSFNIPDRVIISDTNISPWELAGDCGPLPDLQSWSDINFLQWEKLYHDANKPLESPKYVIQKGVANDRTKEIARQALGVSTDFNDWSQFRNGIAFKSGTDNFRALLSTPLGQGAAWFLTQHKPQLGEMTVSEITLRGAEGIAMRNGQEIRRWILIMIQKIEPA